MFRRIPDDVGIKAGGRKIFVRLVEVGDGSVEFLVFLFLEPGEMETSKMGFFVLLRSWSRPRRSGCGRISWRSVFRRKCPNWRITPRPFAPSRKPTTSVNFVL